MGNKPTVAAMVAVSFLLVMSAGLSCAGMYYFGS